MLLASAIQNPGCYDIGVLMKSVPNVSAIVMFSNVKANIYFKLHYKLLVIRLRYTPLYKFGNLTTTQNPHVQLLTLVLTSHVYFRTWIQDDALPASFMQDRQVYNIVNTAR